MLYAYYKNLFIIFTTFSVITLSTPSSKKIYFKISLKGQSLATHVCKLHAGHLSMQSLTYNLRNQSQKSFERCFIQWLKAVSQHSIIGKKTNDNISKDKSVKKKEKDSSHTFLKHYMPIISQEYFLSEAMRRNWHVKLLLFNQNWRLEPIQITKDFPKR